MGPTGLLLLALALIGVLAHLLHGRTIRRRVLYWLRKEGLLAPTPCQYRFDEHGIASSEPHLASTFPTWRLQRLAEGREHIFVEIQGAEDLIALPRRALTESQLRQLRDWEAFCLGSGAVRPGEEDIELATTAEGAHLSLRFTLTPEDRIAAILRQLERLWPLRRSLCSAALAIVPALLLVPVAMVFLWAIDPHRPPWDIALPLFGEMLVTTFWPLNAGLCALVVLITAINQAMRRPRAKSLARTLHGRASNDPVDILLSDDGVAIRQRGAVNRYDWAAFRAVERRGEHLFVHLQRGEPLLLPLRALDAAQIAVLDQLAERHLGQAGGAG